MYVSLGWSKVRASYGATHYGNARDEIPSGGPRDVRVHGDSSLDQKYHSHDLCDGVIGPTQGGPAETHVIQNLNKLGQLDTIRRMKSVDGRYFSRLTLTLVCTLSSTLEPPVPLSSAQPRVMQFPGIMALTTARLKAAESCTAWLRSHCKGFPLRIHQEVRAPAFVCK